MAIANTHSLSGVERMNIPPTANSTKATRETSPRPAIKSKPLGQTGGVVGSTVPPIGKSTCFSSPLRFHCVLRTGAKTVGSTTDALFLSDAGLPSRKLTSIGSLGSAPPGNGINVASPACRAVTGRPLTDTAHNRTGASGNCNFSVRWPRDLT